MCFECERARYKKVLSMLQNSLANIREMKLIQKALPISRINNQNVMSARVLYG